MIGTTVLCIILGLDGIYSRIDGAILVGSFIAYSYYLYIDERKHYKEEDNQLQSEEVANGAPPTSRREVLRDAGDHDRFAGGDHHLRHDRAFGNRDHC